MSSISREDAIRFLLVDQKFLNHASLEGNTGGATYRKPNSKPSASSAPTGKRPFNEATVLTRGKKVGVYQRHKVKSASRKTVRALRRTKRVERQIRRADNKIKRIDKRTQKLGEEAAKRLLED